MNEQLKKMALDQAKESFIDSWLKKTPEDEQEINGLGILIANHYEWDGVRIMKAFAIALEDANFSTESATICNWIEYLSRE